MSESQAKNVGGRPSTFDPRIVDQMLNKLSDGVPLAEICREPGMPCPNTVRTWAKDRPELSEAIAHAREDGHDIISADLRKVARGGDGSSGDVVRDKLIVDTDLKLLAKWDPKRYGDKQQLEHSGSIGATPTDPEQVAQQFITMGTQYPTLNPLIRKMAEDILAKLPEIP